MVSYPLSMVELIVNSLDVEGTIVRYMNGTRLNLRCQHAQDGQTGDQGESFGNHGARNV